MCGAPPRPCNASTPILCRPGGLGGGAAWPPARASRSTVNVFCAVRACRSDAYERHHRETTTVLCNTVSMHGAPAGRRRAVDSVDRGRRQAAAAARGGTPAPACVVPGSLPVFPRAFPLCTMPPCAIASARGQPTDRGEVGSAAHAHTENRLAAPPSTSSEPPPPARHSLVAHANTAAPQLS